MRTPVLRLKDEAGQLLAELGLFGDLEVSEIAFKMDGQAGRLIIECRVKPESEAAEKTSLPIRSLTDIYFPLTTQQITSQEEFLLMPLEALELDPRVTNILKRHIETVGDLLQLSRSELLDVHGIGPYSVRKIEERLAQLGLALKVWPPSLRKAAG